MIKEYQTEVYSDGKLIATLTKFARIGDKQFFSGICPACFCKANWVTEFGEGGWFRKSKRCSCSNK